ncbi:glycoside hydrolase family 88 protein [Sphingobacterium suaedae]
MFYLVAFLGLVSCVPIQASKDEQALKSTVDSALAFATKQSMRMAEKYKYQEGELPRTFQQGKDISSDSRWWCSGFFPGVLWYVYENDPNPDVLEYAKLYTARVEREKYTTDNHDVGFMIYCSFGNGYRLTQDPHYKAVMLTAAQSLATRYNPKVGLIRSWDHNREQWQYPVIIDNIMNLELLLWASVNSDDKRLKDIALSHADKTMVHHFRRNYSSYHVVSYDTVTAIPHRKQTHQGYSDESSWSRGQAWGLYGYTYLYRETGDERYLRQAVLIADYLLHHPNMPEDYIPYWDYDSPEIPETYRDVSAATIMASALIDLSSFVDGDRVEQYSKVIATQILTLASPAYTAKLGENGCFILKHSVGAYPLKSEVDVPLTYADYYYLEALTKLKRKIH